MDANIKESCNACSWCPEDNLILYCLWLCCLAPRGSPFFNRCRKGVVLFGSFLFFSLLPCRWWICYLPLCVANIQWCWVMVLFGERSKRRGCGQMLFTLFDCRWGGPLSAKYHDCALALVDRDVRGTHKHNKCKRCDLWEERNASIGRSRTL